MVVVPGSDSLIQGAQTIPLHIIHENTGCQLTPHKNRHPLPGLSFFLPYRFALFGRFLFVKYNVKNKWVEI